MVMHVIVLRVPEPDSSTHFFGSQAPHFIAPSPAVCTTLPAVHQAKSKTLLRIRASLTMTKASLSILERLLTITENTKVKDQKIELRKGLHQLMVENRRG